MWVRVFPTVIIILYLVSAVVYAFHEPFEWRKVVYWTALAVVQYSITW